MIAGFITGFIAGAAAVIMLANYYHDRQERKKGNGQDNGTCSPTTEHPGFQHNPDGSSQRDSDIGG